jgi:diaminopimelate epimerase
MPTPFVKIPTPFLKMPTPFLKMPTPFLKMHGAGNDFMVIDARKSRLALTAGQVRALADRRTGIGWDQLILLEPSAAATAAMRIYNPDGSIAGACGNATRCVADFLAGEVGLSELTIETAAGLLPAKRLPDGAWQIDMGPPGLRWQDIPLAHPADTLHLDLEGDPAAASMGNPHATFFVPDLAAIDPNVAGPPVENHAIFPDRANVGFAQILAPDTIRLRVWERGAGLTRACGSGACAALVNAHRRGLAGRRAEMLLDGGTLVIEWREADGHVLMTGPAVTAFHGCVDLATYPA